MKISFGILFGCLLIISTSAVLNLTGAENPVATATTPGVLHDGPSKARTESEVAGSIQFLGKEIVLQYKALPKGGVEVRYGGRCDEIFHGVGMMEQNLGRTKVKFSEPRCAGALALAFIIWCGSY